ncbi:MAG: transposase [Clostridia bacterium]|nr:transposase [Clostridia bacterium]
MILDTYRPHRSIAPEYESKYQGRLHFMFLPPYSPELNPQENVWAWLKDYCARDSAYSADKELPQRICKLFVYAYNTPRTDMLKCISRCVALVNDINGIKDNLPRDIISV